MRYKQQDKWDPSMDSHYQPREPLPCQPTTKKMTREAKILKAQPKQEYWEIPLKKKD